MNMQRSSMQIQDVQNLNHFQQPRQATLRIKYLKTPSFIMRIFLVVKKFMNLLIHLFAFNFFTLLLLNRLYY